MNENKTDDVLNRDGEAEQTARPDDKKPESNTAEQPNAGAACGKGCDKDCGKGGKKDRKEAGKEEKKLREENQRLSASLSELTDKYTRMLAEYDNFRKRAAKERDGIYGDACADVLKEVLTVKDHLEMAMKFAGDDDFAKGVSMTLTKFGEILGKLGVEEFGKAGEPFDPNLHNAVFHTEDPSLGENVIAEIMMKGYRKGDKIIRYAMVKVAN